MLRATVGRCVSRQAGGGEPSEPSSLREVRLVLYGDPGDPAAFVTGERTDIVESFLADHPVTWSSLQLVEQPELPDGELAAPLAAPGDPIVLAGGPFGGGGAVDRSRVDARRRPLRRRVGLERRGQLRRTGRCGGPRLCVGLGSAPASAAQRAKVAGERCCLLGASGRPRAPGAAAARRLRRARLRGAAVPRVPPRLRPRRVRPAAAPRA